MHRVGVAQAEGSGYPGGPAYCGGGVHYGGAVAPLRSDSLPRSEVVNHKKVSNRPADARSLWSCAKNEKVARRETRPCRPLS